MAVLGTARYTPQACIAHLRFAHAASALQNAAVLALAIASHLPTGLIFNAPLSEASS